MKKGRKMKRSKTGRGKEKQQIKENEPNRKEKERRKERGEERDTTPQLRQRGVRMIREGAR